MEFHRSDFGTRYIVLSLVVGIHKTRTIITLGLFVKALHYYGNAAML